MGGVLEGSDFFEVSKYIGEKVCGEDNWSQFIVNFCQFKDNSGS